MLHGKEKGRGACLLRVRTENQKFSRHHHLSDSRVLCQPARQRKQSVLCRSRVGRLRPVRTGRLYRRDLGFRRQNHRRPSAHRRGADRRIQPLHHTDPPPCGPHQRGVGLQTGRTRRDGCPPGDGRSTLAQAKHSRPHQLREAADGPQKSGTESYHPTPAHDLYREPGYRQNDRGRLYGRDFPQDGTAREGARGLHQPQQTGREMDWRHRAEDRGGHRSGQGRRALHRRGLQPLHQRQGWRPAGLR